MCGIRPFRVETFEFVTMLVLQGRVGLWIAFGCMFIPMLIFWFKAMGKPPGQRKVTPLPGVFCCYLCGCDCGMPLSLWL